MVAVPAVLAVPAGPEVLAELAELAVLAALAELARRIELEQQLEQLAAGRLAVDSRPAEGTAGRTPGRTDYSIADSAGTDSTVVAAAGG